MPEPLPRQQIWHLTGRRLGAYRFAYDAAGVASLDELHAEGWAPIALSNLGGAAPASVLDDLSDVDVTTIAPTAGDVLAYDGTAWVNAAAPPAEPYDLGAGLSELVNAATTAPFTLGTAHKHKTTPVTGGGSVTVPDAATLGDGYTATLIAVGGALTLSSATANQGMLEDEMATIIVVGGVIRVIVGLSGVL